MPVTRFEIIDGNGDVIDTSPNEDEMRDQFQRYVDKTDEVAWDGDLKLVQVLAVHR